VQGEQDFPAGHPARFDYNPASPEAIEWARINVHPKGERAYPVDHPRDGQEHNWSNSAIWQPGIDPDNPDREEFTGRSPEQAAAVRALNAQLAAQAKESPALEPGIAPAPPAAQ
jgi:hypothetical protein